MLCRQVYNAALQERRQAWQNGGVRVTYDQQKAELPGIKEAMPEYGAVHSQVLQEVVLRVERAFQAFYRRVKDGETPGYPRLHGRDRSTSFTSAQCEHGARLDTGVLVLSKIGPMAMRWSRPREGRPKTVTSSTAADSWSVCSSCADVPVMPLPPTGQETGVDRGSEAFATRSDGTRILHPGWYRKADRALKMAPRRVTRRKRGSNRRRKAVIALAKAQQTVRRQRQDVHHKTARQLVRHNDALEHEELPVRNMVRNHHLAKRISDAGWSAFLTILPYKAACAGREVVAVPPAFTSQLCSGCGIMVAKGVSVRWHSCPDCGASLHRDHNAARNRERACPARQGGVALAASEN
jgi:putative transposase